MKGVTGTIVLVMMLVSCDTAQDNRDKIEKTIPTVDRPVAIKEEQWDFCHCVRVGDSINALLRSKRLTDVEFERLSQRFDTVEKRCRDFRIEDPSRSPEDRKEHAKKVKKCLE